MAQRDALDALKEYNVTLSEFDRLTCGAMTKYMKDADITLSAEERGIGGLGIYMVKNTMDDVRYQYEKGQNILTIHKKL